MISIPYLSPSGVLALKFRAWAPGGRKYDQHSGQKGRLFNTDAYFYAGDRIGIAEGEMDAIAATEHLGVPTLGVPGVNGWQDFWGPLLRDFTTVYIFADGDDPGHKFGLEMADMIGWRARLVPCPDGEDVSSMCATGRASELLALVTTSNEADDA